MIRDDAMIHYEQYPDLPEFVNKNTGCIFLSSEVMAQASKSVIPAAIYFYIPDRQSCSD